jgi:hypothetical protein
MLPLVRLNWPWRVLSVVHSPTFGKPCSSPMSYWIKQFSNWNNKFATVRYLNVKIYSLYWKDSWTKTVQRKYTYLHLFGTKDQINSSVNPSYERKIVLFVAVDQKNRWNSSISAGVSGQKFIAISFTQICILENYLPLLRPVLCV